MLTSGVRHSSRSPEVQLAEKPAAAGRPAHTNACLLRPPLPACPATQVSQPLVPLVDEFAARLFGELDYVQEGRNAEKFARLYR